VKFADEIHSRRGAKPFYILDPRFSLVVSPTATRVLVVEFVDRLQDAQTGPDRAFGVVLVGHGRSEYGHHRIADELVDRAPVALDLLSQAGVVRVGAPGRPRDLRAQMRR
jgi:hypothetical protein